MNMKRAFFPLVLIALVGGCISEAEPVSGLVYCSESFGGADVCTARYEPVCARLKSTEPLLRSEWKTYSNACTACTAEEPGYTIAVYLPGTCKEVFGSKWTT